MNGLSNSNMNDRFSSTELAFLVSSLSDSYLEPGNFNIIELAPTVQCLTGNYKIGHNEYKVPYIAEVLNASENNIWYKAYQSEEGERFFKEQNLNMIVEVSDDFGKNVAANYCWMTLNQLSLFLVYNNYLNIAARNLIAAISLKNSNYNTNSK